MVHYNCRLLKSISMHKRDFSYSADNFRAISILFVILSHLVNLSLLNNSLNFFLTDATTWFLFISGYLFFQVESNENFSYFKYLKKKIKFVITPYLIISAPCILAGIYFHQPQIYEISTEKYIAWSLLVGGLVNGPMWFTPMIAIFFLASPVFLNLTQKNTLILLLTAAAGIIISIFSSRPTLNSNPIYSFIHFFGFYMLGLFFFKIRNEIKSLSKSLSTQIIISGILLYAIIASFNSDFDLNGKEYIPFFEAIGLPNSTTLGKLVLLISIFVFLEKYFNIPNKYLRYISSISFGLFFLHGIFIRIFNKNIEINLQNPFYSALLEFIFVFLSSIITIEFSKKILKHRTRYVIGC
ncbi:acyltransferase family protein [Comamonas fluminis]|uniref:acyltransferase family protein n=1 Tax=Comamonas fluminis TaxID=2796366 RepID=UPI003CCE7744